MEREERYQQAARQAVRLSITGRRTGPTAAATLAHSVAKASGLRRRCDIRVRRGRSHRTITRPDPKGLIIVTGIIVLLLIWLGLSVPAYVVGQRRGVTSAGVAFVPFVGPWIVILWSIQRSGWHVLLIVIPVVNVIFAIWVALTVPSEHGRTRWWALAFLIPNVNFVANWVYAFTLETDSTAAIA
jgi:hypothetical protein